MKTFTFGSDHKHPVTGESLWKKYIQVPGDWNESRKIMLAVFGQGWSHQYSSPSEAGKDKYDMQEVVWSPELLALVDANIPEDDPLWSVLLSQLEWSRDA
jgi:hypothetical protein